MTTAPPDLRAILTAVTDPAIDPVQIAHTLRNTQPSILTSGIPSTTEQDQPIVQDPLTVLDPATHSLPVLFILCARLHASHTAGVPSPSWEVVTDFCKRFNPEHVRLVPDKIVMLAKGVIGLAEHCRDQRLCIDPLLDIVMRYPPDPSHLTPIHPQFLLYCVTTQTYSPSLPLLLSHPITSIYPLPSPSSDSESESQSQQQQDTIHIVNSTDVLLYHYLAGISLACMKRYAEAEDYLESAVCICPSGSGSSGGGYGGGAYGLGMGGGSVQTGVSAIQVEAAKKLWLVQLIAYGKISPLPKHAHNTIVRLMKGSVYNTLAGHYPLNTGAMKSLLEKEKKTFITDQTLGLALLAISRAPRWAIMRLTRTYISLSLEDVTQAEGVKILDFDSLESSTSDSNLTASGSTTTSAGGGGAGGAGVSAAGAAALARSQSLQSTQSDATVGAGGAGTDMDVDADGDVEIGDESVPPLEPGETPAGAGAAEVVVPSANRPPTPSPSGAGIATTSVGANASAQAIKDTGRRMTKEEVREVVADMIANNEIQAQFSASDPDVIVFSSSPSSSSSSSTASSSYPATPPSGPTLQALTSALKEAESQANLLKKLEEEWESSREYLARAIKAKDESSSGGGGGATLVGNVGGSGGGAFAAGLPGAGVAGLGSTLEDDEAMFGTGGGRGGGSWAEDTQFF